MSKITHKAKVMKKMQNKSMKLATILVGIIILFSCEKDKDASGNGGSTNENKTFIKHYPLGLGTQELSTDQEGNIVGHTGIDTLIRFDPQGNIISKEWVTNEEQLEMLDQIGPNDNKYYTASATERDILSDYASSKCDLSVSTRDFIYNQTTQERNIDTTMFYDNGDGEYSLICLKNGTNNFGIIRQEYKWVPQPSNPQRSTDLWFIKMSGTGNNLLNHDVIWGEVYNDPAQRNLFMDAGSGYSMTTRLRNGGLFHARNRVRDFGGHALNKKWDTKYIYTDGNGNILSEHWFDETNAKLCMPDFPAAVDLSNGNLLVASYLKSYRGDFGLDFFEYLIMIDDSGEIVQKLKPSDLHPRFTTLEDDHKNTSLHYIKDMAEHPDGSLLILMEVSLYESQLSATNLEAGYYLFKLDPDDLSYETTNIP